MTNQELTKKLQEELDKNIALHNALSQATQQMMKLEQENRELKVNLKDSIELNDHLKQKMRDWKEKFSIMFEQLWNTI